MVSASDAHTHPQTQKAKIRTMLRPDIEVLFQRTTNSITIEQVERVNTLSPAVFHSVYLTCFIRIRYSLPPHSPLTQVLVISLPKKQQDWKWLSNFMKVIIVKKQNSQIRCLPFISQKSFGSVAIRLDYKFKYTIYCSMKKVSLPPLKPFQESRKFLEKILQ